MLIRPPLGELRQIVDDLVAVGVENMRSVFMVEDSRLVGLVIGIAADMRAPVHQQHARAVLARETLCENGAGKAGANDQIVKAAAGRRPRAKGRVHSAATSNAELLAPVRVPSASAMSPDIRA